MSDIVYSIIKDESEIDILRDRSSFNYVFDEELIELLKTHFLLPNSLYILAKVDNEFVGFCSIDSDWWEDGYFFIREILVDPAFRGKNVGDELMSRCIAHAKEKGAKGVVTETSFENTSMQNLCKKLNFKEYDNLQWREGITYKLNFNNMINKKVLIICMSYHHGNTMRIAEMMGKTLSATIIKPTEINTVNVADYDLIGFGSGIYNGQHHITLFNCLETLGSQQGKKAFIFSTSTIKVSKLHQPLREKLIQKGYEIVGEFQCRGFINFGIVKYFFGGLNKKHPNNEDFKKAVEFAESLR